MKKTKAKNRKGAAAVAGAAPCSASDWHWSLRSFEIPVSRLCVDCGENVPETGRICDECREDGSCE